MGVPLSISFYDFMVHYVITIEHPWSLQIEPKDTCVLWAEDTYHGNWESQVIQLERMVTDSA